MENSCTYNVNPHMFLSILCTVFCFIPFSIVGLVYSMKTNNLLKQELLDKAFSASESALMWDIISIVTSAMIVLISFIIMLLS